MKNNIFRTFIYTFLFVLSISFFSCPASYTKYDESELEALKYSSELVALDKAQDTVIDNISFDDSRSVATALFTLPKNEANYMDGVSKDSYNIVVPNGCTASHSTIEFIDTASVNVSLTCNLNNSNIVLDDGSIKTLNFEVLVNEKIENDAIPFRYKRYYVNEEIPEVLETVSEDREVVSEDKLKYFQKKITEIVLAKEKYSSFEVEVTNYINSANLSNGQFELLGINVEYDSAKDEFFYQIDENFLGYARTFDSYSREDSEKAMYFSTDKSEDLNSVFEYYLGKYYSSDENANYLILNYVKAKGGIDFVLYNNGEIEGISKNCLSSIRIDANIMEYVSLLNTTDEAFVYNGNDLQERKIFEAIISTNEKIGLSVKEKILADIDLGEFICKDYVENGNNTQYFAFGNMDEALLIEVSLENDYKVVRFTSLVVEAYDCNIKVKLEFSLDNRIDEKYQLDVIGLIEKLYQATYVTDSYFEAESFEKIVVELDLIKDGLLDNEEDSDDTDIDSGDKGTNEGENSGNLDTVIDGSSDKVLDNGSSDDIDKQGDFSGDVVEKTSEKTVEMENSSDPVFDGSGNDLESSVLDVDG